MKMIVPCNLLWNHLPFDWCIFTVARTAQLMHVATIIIINFIMVDEFTVFWLQEPPMPIPPSMFNTWPAKSEMGHRKKAKSPTPPEGGAFQVSMMS